MPTTPLNETFFDYSRSELTIGGSSASLSRMLWGGSPQASARSEPSRRYEDNLEQQEDLEDMRICNMFQNHRSYVKPTIESHPLMLTNEMLGVEIELENVTTSFQSRLWNQISDGSLRNNGREYVFRQPLGGADAFRALTEIGKHFHEIQPDPSWRCSTHVHLDVRDLTVEQLKKLLLVYVIYEEVLFKASGYNRYRNNFGPAYGFAQQQITILSKHWNKEGRAFVNNVLSEWSKYTSLNLLPIGRFGSVEFRISNPFTSTSDLLRLCNRILMVKKLAVEWGGSEKELIQHCLDTDPNDVFNKKLLGLKFGSIDKIDIMKGCILANDMVELRTFRHNQGGELPCTCPLPVMTAISDHLQTLRDIPEGMLSWVSNYSVGESIPEDYLGFIISLGFPRNLIVSETVSESNDLGLLGA